MHYYAESQAFEMSQEFIAATLGVRRPAVSHAAGQLQAAGMITYSRSRMRIVDSTRLKQQSCECYGFIRLPRQLIWPSQNLRVADRRHTRRFNVAYRRYIYRRGMGVWYKAASSLTAQLLDPLNCPSFLNASGAANAATSRTNRRDARIAVAAMA
jgi:biotin operon repressor